jgi:aconitate hydratase 2/2-methylisocitrate dehydratase
VGTGGDSHTRFPIGLSFPAGSDLVAFAASQGYFPLDMPESVLVRFRGNVQPGITVRDLVNAIPYAALQQGKLNLEKGDAKVNIFADRVLEMEGLEHLTVEEAYKLTDTSAERSAAGATFHHDPSQVVAYVENHLRYLKNNFRKRHAAKVVDSIIEAMEDWLAKPTLMERDDEPTYAEVLEVDLDTIREPLLAAPNDPDKIVALSEVAGTPIDEVFVGSCMADITDFRAVATILEGSRVQHRMKVWTVPPDRESNAELTREGVHAKLLEAGANVHVPGCSLCMGNQGQVATGATVLSTSTRNFDNRAPRSSSAHPNWLRSPPSWASFPASRPTRSTSRSSSPGLKGSGAPCSIRRDRARGQEPQLGETSVASHSYVEFPGGLSRVGGSSPNPGGSS